MPNDSKRPDQAITEAYEVLVRERHPDIVMSWPLIAGYNSRTARYKQWHAVILEHTGSKVVQTWTWLGDLPEAAVGVPEITVENREHARQRIIRYFNLRPHDGVVLLDPSWNDHDDLERLLRHHERALGMTPTKVFLSHKGADKIRVRNFKETLTLLGFDPWLDEEALQAGMPLDRGIRKGFEDSCAAVFFITPNFVDEQFLAAEIDYAMEEKRLKGDRFAIITLVFNTPEAHPKVPALLTRYVWKEPATDLEALREIVRALPISVGPTYWKA